MLVSPEGEERLINLTNTIFYEGCGYDMEAYQVRLVRKVIRNRRVICNKARKVGISYALAALCLAVAIALGKNSAIVSPSLETSRRVMEYLRDMLVKIKRKIVLEFDAESATKIKILNAGTVYALPNSPNTVLGLTINGVQVIDEFAHFMDKDDELIFTALGPATVLGGHIVGVSTPCGERGLFHEIWTQETKHPNWTRDLIHWKECSRFDEKAARESVISEEAFQQEFCNAFIGDSESEINWADIRACVDPNLSYEDVPPSSSKHLYSGVDIGRTHDFTALTTLREQEDGTLHMIGKLILKKMPFPDQQAALQPWILNSTATRIDKGGLGMQIAEHFANKAPGRVQPTDMQSVKELAVTYTKRAIIERRIKYPDDVMLQHSILAIKRKRTPGGNKISYDSNRNDEIGHADLFWALALAVLCAEENKDAGSLKSMISTVKYNRQRTVY